MKKAIIAIAAHKPYRMPEDDIYLPLHVGCEGKKEIGFTGDNTGKNISAKNPYYCELTGLYWLWKNTEAEYKGLVHYRRHFTCETSSQKKKNAPFSCILTSDELESLIKKSDIILPKKRKYYIETLYSHYAHTHYAEHLDITREIISENYPDYLISFDRVMKRRSAHMFNMFIMKSDKADAYCSWLFPILEELEKRIDVTQYDSFQARLFGRVSELLLDVWLDKNKYPYTETAVLSTEKIDWSRKIKSFLAAKFGKKQYDSSF